MRFRAITTLEHCKKSICHNCEYNEGFCSYFTRNGIFKDENRPYRTTDGKYIFVEVKEWAESKKRERYYLED